MKRWVNRRMNGRWMLRFLDDRQIEIADNDPVAWDANQPSDTETADGDIDSTAQDETRQGEGGAVATGQVTGTALATEGLESQEREGVLNGADMGGGTTPAASEFHGFVVNNQLDVSDTLHNDGSGEGNLTECELERANSERFIA